MEANTILVPVRYPLSEQSRRTMAHALTFAVEVDARNLVVLHVNLFQEGPPVCPRDLRGAIEGRFGAIDAEYVVRDGFLLEEAILDEAVSREADCIVVGKNERSRWRTRLRRLLDLGVDVETALEERSDRRVEVAD